MGKYSPKKTPIIKPMIAIIIYSPSPVASKYLFFISSEYLGILIFNPVFTSKYNPIIFFKKYP